VLHGLMLIDHRAFQGFCKTRPGLDRVLQSAPGTVLRVAVTFLAVSLGWVFFRAASFGAAAEILRRLVSAPRWAMTAPMSSRSFWCLAAVLLLGHLLVYHGLWRRWQGRLPAPVLGMGYALLLSLVLVLAPDGSKAFIYFQF
jgi:D-alanyl-lipoteichoic acid acyltransferase DltB (MBOAT superfamily)